MRSKSNRKKQHNRSLHISILGLIVPSFILIILFLGFTFVFSFPLLEQQLIGEKKLQIKEQVQTAVSVLDHYYKIENQGDVSLEKAQEEAKNIIRYLRYGEENENYFFIADENYISVMHPFRKEREGQDLSSVRDINGKYYIVELVNEAKENGEGFVSYDWYLEGPDSETVPKMSYVFYFEPWEWMVGTGVYVHEVSDVIEQEKNNTIILLFLFTLVAALLIWIILSMSVSIERKRIHIEQELRLSEERHRILFEKSQDAILIIQPPDWKYKDVNQAACDLFGIDDKEHFLMLSPKDLSPPLQPNGESSEEAAMSKIQQAMEEGFAYFEWTHCKIDGTPFEASVLVSKMNLPDGVILQGTIRDISIQKLLEKKLRHSQKMESIGRLAGGVAHDFNNILGSITNAAEVLSDELKGQPHQKELVDMIMEAAYRSSGLTKKLLSFSRKGKLQFKEILLNNLIHDMIQLLKRSLDPKISLKFHSTLGDVLISGDPGQLENALLNLCLNSRDAMPNGGDIEIALDAPTEKEGKFLPRNKKWIQIQVKDNGPGIPLNIQDKIFDPFFSTKDPGKGNGLGLAAVQGCIEEHGGNIFMKSIPNEGCSFYIFLPLIENEMPIQ